MIEYMRVEGTITEVYDRITSSYSEESDEDEIDFYLKNVEMKCNPNFMSTPLGVTLVLSLIIVFGALVFTLTRRFYK